MKTAKQKALRPAKTAPRPAESTSSGVDWPEINRVLDFMAEHVLEEFEYGNSDVHIRLKRAGALPAMAHAPSGPMHAPTPIAVAHPAPAAVRPAVPAEPVEDLHTIKSPIVGTYYSAPNPESATFVKVGDTVSAGQVLCIIEAMKLMNEIESDVAGEIVKIFPENGHPVEYGEPLFAIRKK